METVPAKHIVSRTKDSGWFGCGYNMNIYRGCCHGCIYCDSRSDCYRVDDFDTVKAKENALTIIRDDLRRKVLKGVVATGSMSDPYNPFEKQQCLTRHALELLNAYGFGAAIATKSPLVTRDVDVLSDIKAYSPVLVKMTITTADDDLCRIIEPNAAVSSERFAALRRLSDAGIYCGVLLMPALPFICDTPENAAAIARMAHEAGARFVYPAFGVTLRGNQRDYYYDKLDIHFPGLRGKYEKTFGGRYSCVSPRAKEIWPVFAAECERLGLFCKMKDIAWDYQKGYEQTQLSLF